MALIKAVSQTAPAHIPREDFLFFRGGKALLGFNLFQSSDSGHICSVFLAAGAVTQLWIGNVKVAALVCGYLRVQGGKHNTLPLRLRRGKDSGLFFFGGLFRLWLLLRQFTTVSVFLLIPVIRMGNHFIKIQICQITIQFRQTLAGNLMDDFSIHLIHQPKSSQVSKNLYRVLTVGSGAERQIHMAEIGKVCLLFKDFHAILVNELLGFFQFVIGSRFLCKFLKLLHEQLQIGSNFILWVSIIKIGLEGIKNPFPLLCIVKLLFQTFQSICV